MVRICVFCSSSKNIEDSYKEIAIETGKLMARDGHSLVYGGSDVGMMKAIAEAVHENGGKVTGVLPEIFSNLTNEKYEIISAKDLRDRKAIMEENSDAFICLPGGLGTLSEIADVLDEKQLHIHNKPLVIVNTNGFFDKLVEHIDKTILEGFSPEDNHKLFQVVDSPQEAFEYIENYKPPKIKKKSEIY